MSPLSSRAVFNQSQDDTTESDELLPRWVEAQVCGDEPPPRWIEEPLISNG